MTALNRSRKARDVRRNMYAENVATAVGPISPGCEIYGLSRGQFSLIDLMEHILDYSGPADVVISTWTAAGADIDYSLRLCGDGRIRSLLWLVDSSFQSRQPGYCAAMREHFGDEAIRITENHAKFVMFGNETWHLVLRTSMNLNENRRLESFEVSDDPNLYSYLAEVVGSLSDGTFDKSRQDHRLTFDTDTREHTPARGGVRYR